MRALTYIFFILLILLGLTFAGLNAEPVSLNYYVGNTKLPLSLLLILTLICGGLLGLLASCIVYIRLKSSNSKLRQRVKLVEEELANLRALPLKDDH